MWRHCLDSEINDPSLDAAGFLQALRHAYEGPCGLDFEGLLRTWYELWAQSQTLACDVGAHKGAHSRHLVKLYKHVHCFEPLLTLVPGVQSALTSALAPHKNYTLHPVALGSKAAEAEFVINAGALEESGLRERAYTYPETAQLCRAKIPVQRLDEALHARKGRLGYIKIDAEGAEVDILSGAAEILRRDRCVVSVEYGADGYAAYGCTARSLYDFAQSVGYTVFNIFGYPLEPLCVYETCINVFNWDYFLIPSENKTLLALIRSRRGEILRRYLPFQTRRARLQAAHAAYAQLFSHQPSMNGSKQFIDAAAATR